MPWSWSWSFAGGLRLRNRTQVLHIAHDLGTHDENREQRESSQRRAFLRELEAMIRLRSLNTVNVYGAVTSLPDRMVLVMELLAGGDLLALLRRSETPLHEEQSRRIIRDICAGMAFLHSKKTTHGDLKSANILLDGDGRAKVMYCGLARINLVFAFCTVPLVVADSTLSLPCSCARSAIPGFHTQSILGES